ncbi:MAG: hypothetical protein D6730_01820 [Bacteroidetes bacterium]|nr:MAG: hypothetical protein D6730_01820 [Bacteroidota bacterium]
MESLEHYIHIVEDSIGRIGIDPAPSRGKQPGQWNLRKGSAQIALDLFRFKEDGPLFFSVMSPIMKVPKSNMERLATELLKINHSMAGTAFTLFRDLIFVRAIREAAGMDAVEAMNLILRVGNNADYFDEKLQQEFPHQQPIGFRTGNSQPE